MPSVLFTPERDLPPGVGFSLFGPEHLSALGCVAAVSALVVLWGVRLPRKGRLRLLRCMAATMILMEIGKDATLAALGAFSVGYLPLHLCSLCMFLCLFHAWKPDNDAGGQLVWSLCFSGGLAALLFPDWTDMPILHFQSLHSFLYHGMLVQFALIAVISGQAKPRVGKIWKVMLFLICAAVPVYFLNRRLHTNYMFLNRPSPGSPLELLGRLPGTWGYLVGYAALAAAVLVLLNLPMTLWARRKRMPRQHRQM